MAIPRLRESKVECGTLLDIVREEDRLLDEEEARLANRERATALLESELEAKIQRTRDRHVEVLARVGALEEWAQEEARGVLQRMPGLAPPLSKKDKKRASEARRKAIAARLSAIESRERMISLISEGLGTLSAVLGDSEEVLQKLDDDARRRRLELVAQESAAMKATTLRAEKPAREPPGSRGVTERRQGHVQGQPERLLPRARLDCAVGLGTDNNFYTGFAQNVSTGGLFVATFDLLPEGTELELHFSLPSGSSVSTRAVVRWTRDANDLTPELWPGLGLQFQDLSPDAVEAVESFVREREPLFFPDA